jgi:hypothetical protein
MFGWREPASISYQRKRGTTDPVLEPLNAPRPPGSSAYIVVCGMGTKVVFIRWYARSVEEVRQTFRMWLAETWQTLATDFTGTGVPNGMDFKPGRVDWFNIAP